MALTNYRKIGIYPHFVNGGGNTGLSFSLNSGTNKWSAGFIVSESITLAKLAVYIHSENGTSPAYTWRIETDNGSGRPSGTLAWTDATVDVTVTASGWTSLQSLTASSAITPGTIYHFVIQPSGSAPDGSNYVAIKENGMTALSAPTGSAYLPCYSNRYNGSWSNGSGAPVFVLSDSTSTVMFGNVADTQNVYTFTNTAWKGFKFTAPATMTAWGAQIEKLNSTSAGTVSCMLIDSTNTIRATGSIPAGFWDVNTARADDLFIFDTPYQITSGETYRVVWKDTAGQQRTDVLACGSSTFKSLLPGAGDLIFTEGTSSDGSASPTSWTDSDDEIPIVGLWGSSVSSGGGGGSSGPRFGPSGGFPSFSGVAG